MLLLTACTVVRTDPRGVTHIWAIGYVRIASNTPQTEPNVRVTSLSTYGGSMGIGRGDYHLSLGYRSWQRLVVYHPDLPVRIIQDGSDLSQAAVDISATMPPAAGTPHNAAQPPQPKP